MLMAPYSITSLSHRSSIIWLRENRPIVTIVKAHDAGPPTSGWTCIGNERCTDTGNLTKATVYPILRSLSCRVRFSRYVIRRVIFTIRWNFHSIGISVLKMALRENFNANFNNGRRILATSSGIGIELLPIRLISSGTSFFQARRPSRGLPRYLLPCPWGSRARRICYSICKGLNI